MNVEKGQENQDYVSNSKCESEPDLLSQRKSCFAENELINLDDIELSDEETWLYTAEKNSSPKQQEVRPYKWSKKNTEDNVSDPKKKHEDFINKLTHLDLEKSLQLSHKNESSSKPYTEKLSKALPSSVNDISDTESSKITPKAVNNERCQQNQISNASDIMEKARLQEESLKQSSSKFLKEAAYCVNSSQLAALKSPSHFSNPKIYKPGSLEALHLRNGTTSPNEHSQLFSNSHFKGKMGSPNRSPFGSTATLLNYALDVHRSSLPNLNRGYYSLKPRKDKVSSHCPLPVYPRHDRNGLLNEHSQLPIARSNVQAHPVSPNKGAYQTLPSSYKKKSNTTSSPQRSQFQSVINRRESLPFPMCQTELRNPRRESLPCVAFRKQSVQYSSPKKNSEAANIPRVVSKSAPRNYRSGSLVQLPLEPNVRIPQDRDGLFQSPTKHQPLSSVHNHSLAKDDPQARDSRNQVSKKSSPAQRSGIPVPSQVLSQTDSTDFDSTVGAKKK